MIIQITSVHFKNFLSHKETKLGWEYFQNQNYLITGENRDDLGMLSNGSGKSNLVEGILCCLTGETFKGLKGDDIIMKGEKSCRLRVNLLMDGEKKGYIIYQRKPNKLIFHNGDKKVHASDMKELFRKIQNFIGYDFKSLTRFVMIGENDKNRFSFLESNDSEKKEILSMLIDVKEIDEAYESVKKGIELYEKQQIEYGSRLSIQKEVIERYKGNLHRFREDLKAFKQEESRDVTGIVKIKKKYKKLLKIYKELNRSIKAINDTIHETKKEADAKIKKSKGIIESYTNHIKHCEGLIKGLEIMLAGIITCPHCGKEINPSEKSKNKIKEEIRDYQKINEDSIKDIQKLQKEIDKTYSECEKTASRLNEKMDNLEESFNETKEAIENCKSLIRENDIKKSEKKKNILKAIKSVKAEIAECERKYKEDEEAEEKNDRRLELYKKLKFHFGKEGFKNYLFSRKIKIVEQEVNDILLRTKTKLKVTLSGMSKTKSGKFNQKISAVIEIDGVKNNWNELSKGQKRRIDLAFILAFSRLTNSKNNFMFRSFDEPFGGLDKVGEDNVLDMLSKLNHAVWILSPQERMKERFDSGDMITVVKEKGISYIKNGSEN